MSDSDEDLTENNIVFQNENTFLRGGQASFLSNRFKNTASSAYNSMCAQNFNNGYGFNMQRSIYQRRETSPMSLHSVPDFAQHNFDNSRFVRGTTCERSVINGRSQSPGSVGSMDSTTSAAYVAQIFKNMKFNKYDKRIINEAYNKYFRNRTRRRIGKRRKLKLFLKHNRRKSDDSGDEGSNSSISSDDNRSVRSAIPKESILRPSNRTNKTEILNFRATMKESDLYKDCTENLKHSTIKSMFNDLNHIKHSTQMKTNILIEKQKDYNSMSTTHPRTNGVLCTQKDRFTKGFMLPSQRFHSSIIKPVSDNSLSFNLEAQSVPNTANIDNMDSENEDIFPNQTIRENSTICRKRTLENHDICSDEKRNKLSSLNPNDDTTFKKPLMPIRKQVKAKPNFLSDQIVSKYSHPLMNNMGPTSLLSQSLNHERLNISNYSKKGNGLFNTKNNLKPVNGINKVSISDSDKDPNGNKNLTNAISQQIAIENEERDKNDNIASPIKTKPSKTSNVKKSNSKRKLKEASKEEKEKHIVPNENVIETEKLISKSSQPLVGNIEIIKPVQNNINEPKSGQGKTEKSSDANTSEMPVSISDVSMKPSFIKRKLFTQKLDIVEEKNSSVDSIATNSPQTRNYRFREKNKVRKLAVSQSCLSRDVTGEENILDLIHKIVPANQINLTSASNQKTRNSNLDNEDKWDVASVISMCNNTIESETFTDEDIFQVTNAKNKNQRKNNSKKTFSKQKCEIIEEVPLEDLEEVQSNLSLSKTNCTTKRTVASRVRSFWDTDFETDVEENVRSPSKTSTYNLAPIADREPVQCNKNGLKPKDNGILSKCISQESEMKSVDNCELIKANTNIVKGDNNFTKDSKISLTKGTRNNTVTRNNIKSLGKKEVTNNSCEAKLLNNRQKKANRTPNSKKTAEKKGDKVITKYNTKEEKVKCNVKKQNSVKPLEAKAGKKNAENNSNILSKELKSQSVNNTESKQENKIEGKGKLIHKLKEARIYLNDSLNTSLSTSEHSILTRSLTLKNKKQVLNYMNEKISTPKPKLKSIDNNTTKRTPRTNNKVKSIKKQITKTTSKSTKTTPPRKAKDKKNEVPKLNESVITTRNRSHNTSLRGRPQQRNTKNTK